MIHLVTLDAPPQRTGGIASWVEDTALALQAQGEEVCLHAPSARSSEAWDAKMPFSVHRMWGRSWGRHQGRWVQMQLPRHIENGDAVLYSTWRLAEHSAGRFQAPQAIAIHGSDLSALGSDASRFVATCQKVNQVFAVSQYLCSLAAKLGVQARLLPMPLAQAPMRLEPNEELLVVARLTPLKAVDRAIRLSKMLERPLRVLGDGPERQTLEAEGPQVIFEGRVSRERVGQAMNQAAATVLLSKAGPMGEGAEGLGLVLLEAQARGCPVIASATGGLPEAARLGLIIEDAEDPDLARIRAFLDDSGAGDRAQQWVRAHHSPILCARALLEALT